MILKICSLKIGSKSFSYKAERDFKHFFFIYQTKRKDPKKDLKLLLSNRKFSLPFF
ncbi:hypothetical protein NC653_026980 [Populus alba x Populus x berolinensis]|uniref:Uncharacterized protein n=1 Tax=Populus alba x Populus x berolinensis TaxID=444605 RepID=A0AAD6M4I6_9ROSI|nr:hypothetical protein NC653_026980 [Populus alba x Populus x berolinensis]